MISKIKHDLPASIVVFLVALPLCLGVALASGAPLISGIISGIIAGIVVGFLSHSQTSVSGPAAGLTAVVLSSILQLGSFEVFLMAVVLAGFIQLIAGLTKSGFVANYIPSNVIKGLLAAIGIILILKQIPHAVGFDNDPLDDFSFLQRDGENTFSELLNVIEFFTVGPVIISFFSLIALIFWNKTPMKNLKFFPSTLFVVVLGITLNYIYQLYFPSLVVTSEHLVQIPKFDNLNSIITLPNFESIGSYKVWLVAITIAAIASLETLLNLEAIENIDPHKRQASPNRELVAQGVGNIFAGMIGGIPMTSVIVRSSINITSGSKTKFSAIFHGVFLLISVLFFVHILNLIPLASLACILLFTGYKLAKVSLFKEMYKKGHYQFIPFVATILAIVFTDLLIGVLTGLVVSIFYILKSNFSNPFELQQETSHHEDIMVLDLPHQASFLNKASIKDTLSKIPKNSKVIIDATNSKFIDSDVLEVIENFRDTISKEKEIKLNIIGLKKHYQLEDHIQFVNVMDKVSQQKMSPNDILEMLRKGNERFVTGNRVKKYLQQQMNATSVGQNPYAIILSCIDSRTATEHVFDLGLGYIFSIKIAGNILNEDILGSLEFGIHEIGVKLILVMGHTNCSTMVGACNHVKLGNLTTLLAKVGPAMENEKTIVENRNGSNTEFVNKVSEQNVLNTIKRIRMESPFIAELEQKQTIKIVGGIYDSETGKVIFYE
jgi:carbonic anhydrase